MNKIQTMMIRKIFSTSPLSLSPVTILPIFCFLFCILGHEGQCQNHTKNRKQMIESQLKKRGIADEQVLQAMGNVPRHLFVAKGHEEQAYSDRRLPIGHDQTISQPYIVAFMTEAVQVRKGDKILVIGSGAGYQAGVLAVARAVVFS